MDVGTEPVIKPSRRAARLRAAGRVLIVLAGLVPVVAGFLLFVRTYDVTVAYRTAPVCGTSAAGAGADCLRLESGRVVRKKVDTDRENDLSSYKLVVARETAGGDEYDVGEPFFQDVEVGTAIDVGVWKGKVVQISYRGHRAVKPQLPWLPVLGVALLISVGSAAVVHGLHRSREGLRDVVQVGSIVFTVGSFAGSLVLIGAFQWSFPVTITVAVLAWLSTVAACAVVGRLSFGPARADV
ncbi:hypothetical protein [Kitasatospora sp. NPDC056273]|uniref:hypothetical protein n=1 Tax=Kitasatospora sp. NPDC056273 TaxID=3345769 RepID=UPI0035DE87FC